VVAVGVVFGWQHPVRGVRRLTGPTPSEQIADPAAEHSQSDLESALAGDLDGDGTHERVGLRHILTGEQPREQP